jgi:predicted amidohydrolase
MSFQLALIQMLVEGGAKAANLSRALARIEVAATKGAQVVLLPEALDLGWTHDSARTEAEPIPAGGPYQQLAAAARGCGIHICAGLTERAEDEVFNAAVLIGPRGELLLHHRKLNELEIGHHCYDQGDRLAVARTPFGTIGVMICADAFAPGQVVARTLALMGADLILSPSAWAVPTDHDQGAQPYGSLWLDNYRPVARGYRVWIAGVSNVGRLNAGPWIGRKCIGCSLVVGPAGNQVLMGPYGEDADTILQLEVEPEPRPTRGAGWAAADRIASEHPPGVSSPPWN